MDQSNGDVKLAYSTGALSVLCRSRQRFLSRQGCRAGHGSGSRKRRSPSHLGVSFSASVFLDSTRLPRPPRVSAPPWRFRVDGSGCRGFHPPRFRRLDAGISLHGRGSGSVGSERFCGPERESRERPVNDAYNAAMARLLAITGPLKGCSFPLGGTVSIGRDPSSSIVLADETVSRRHAEVTVDLEGVRARDAGSRNGIRVNGKKVKEARLAPGDVLTVGITAAADGADSRDPASAGTTLLPETSTARRNSSGIPDVPDCLAVAQLPPRRAGAFDRRDRNRKELLARWITIRVQGPGAFHRGQHGGRSGKPVRSGSLWCRKGASRGPTSAGPAVRRPGDLFLTIGNCLWPRSGFFAPSRKGLLPRRGSQEVRADVRSSPPPIGTAQSIRTENFGKTCTTASRR